MFIKNILIDLFLKNMVILLMSHLFERVSLDVPAENSPSFTSGYQDWMTLVAVKDQSFHLIFPLLLNLIK